MKEISGSLISHASSLCCMLHAPCMDLVGNAIAKWSRVGQAPMIWISRIMLNHINIALRPWMKEISGSLISHASSLCCMLHASCMDIVGKCYSQVV